ncbi:uncharacterized protein LOC124447253 isoform X2 [Xenia sp. Carnegie-2017]|uniref:uncharacterized protein LOC124447253 isoform X2 n=1 Tax=Xenia sp. Carnegie-2017 TaxID=2897299 RepID=UPI001F03DDAB|nr:uncharacterized protein LOC124447253 isoform X2 [Xenia sp. Carnegie-2017]
MKRFGRQDSKTKKWKSRQAAISLAYWSTKEDNTAIQDTCAKMYELSMLLCNSIDMFAKDYSSVASSLKELLCQEMNLHQLNKSLQQAAGKVSKLKKQNFEKEKNLENLGNAELEYEELKGSFDTKYTKHEILKTQCVRANIIRLADGTKKFAERISTISEAEKKISSLIPLVPTHMRRNKEYQGWNATDELVKETADLLNIAQPMPFTKLLAVNQVRGRRLRAKSCFVLESHDPNKPEEMDWVAIEQSMSASLAHLDMSNTDCSEQDSRSDSELFSCSKEKLHPGGTFGRKDDSDGLKQQWPKNRVPPVRPPPRSPKKKAVGVTFEPYAVSRTTPDNFGLYAQSDLFPLGRKRDMENETKNLSVSDNSGEYTLPRQFSIDKEVVYAVLEENSEENTDKNSYVDIIK